MRYNLTTSRHLRLEATDPQEAQRLQVMAQQADQAGFPVQYHDAGDVLLIPIQQDAGAPGPDPAPQQQGANVARVDCPEHGTQQPSFTVLIEGEPAGVYCLRCWVEHLDDALPTAQPSQGPVRP